MHTGVFWIEGTWWRLHLTLRWLYVRWQRLRIGEFWWNVYESILLKIKSSPFLHWYPALEHWLQEGKACVLLPLCMLPDKIQDTKLALNCTYTMNKGAYLCHLTRKRYLWSISNSKFMGVGGGEACIFICCIWQPCSESVSAPGMASRASGTHLGGVPLLLGNEWLFRILFYSSC